MNNISKIIHLTPEQYLNILKNGSIEVNGEIKEYDDTALYDTGNLDLITWYNSFMEEKYKEIARAHSPYIVKSLEQEYEELTNETNGKASRQASAVGFSAMLKKGDSIVVSTPNFGDFYINEELVTNDYTYNGDSVEIVNVWCFEKKTEGLQMALKLKDTPNYDIVEVDIKNIGMETPEVNSKYYLYANVIKTYNFTLPETPLAASKIISKGASTFNQKYISNIIQEIQSDCTYYPEPAFASEVRLISKANLTKAYFPELKEISGVTSYDKKAFLNGCTNKNLEIYMPKLKRVNSSNNPGTGPFDKVYKVVFPPSVVSLNINSASNNHEVILNCSKAETINTKWCQNTPDNFVMAKDWQASINIAIAAKKHTKDWFIDLFTNYLHDFSGTSTTKELTIPIKVFDELSDEEIDIAENKSWTIGGA